jgi:tetratricopeptide (TPR) repeat protein
MTNVLKHTVFRAVAFCTLWGTIALAGVFSTALGAPRGAELDAHMREQIQWGATSLPLAAQLEYHTALRYAREGDHPRAEHHLKAAVQLAPGFPDAYFTLSRLKFRQFDPDALYYCVAGVKALLANFSAQSLLAVNVLLIGMLGLVVAMSVVLLGVAMRYLPFVAHRLGESLARRLRAAAPRATALLLILLPFAIFPGLIAGTCVLLVMTWHFMPRRERAVLALIATPFIALGLFESRLETLSPVASPSSFTTLVAKTNYAAGRSSLIDALARVDEGSLRAEKHNAMGLLYYRQAEYDTAAEHFLEAIALKPGDATAYVNLGNVYYAQGAWDKALEGYSKAASVDSIDAVGQYNLAQANIKSLLMAESSKALRLASAAGIDEVRGSIATAALPRVEVYPKTLDRADLWRIAMREGFEQPSRAIAGTLEPFLGFSLRVSAWLLIAAFALSMMLSRAIKSKHLAFQCSNCGELTCESCGEDQDDSFICRGCHDVIAEVSSNKVVDALLRRRRQGVVVKRRRRVRWLTLWLPGLREAFYGRLFRGAMLSFIFGVSLVCLWSRGYVWPDWNSIVHPVALWKWIVPAVGVVLSYLISASAGQHVEVRNYRSSGTHNTRPGSTDIDDPQFAQSA